MKKYYIIGAVLVVLIGAGLWYYLTRPTLEGTVAIPYIAHQKPAIDPHLPSANALADKLDEVLFDGLFNLTATSSGVVFEDGLGEFVSIENNIVTIRLKTGHYWHDSYRAFADGKKVTIEKSAVHEFSSKDFAFTLKRIQSLGSLSPDYILIAQALPVMDFEGPNEKNEIKLKFRDNRVWVESDIKEVLSFKILPDNEELNAMTYTVGTTPYMAVPEYDRSIRFYRTPDAAVNIGKLHLVPFVDNSTFSTELRNENINALLETPFGSLSPLLPEQEKYFVKSNVSSTYFAILFNTERLSREKRIQLRKLLNNKMIQDRFFKVGSGQQRHIIDFKGNLDNYPEYLNDGVFPGSSYYVQEKIIDRWSDTTTANPSVLTDTIRIKACLNYGYREEYAELLDILNDPLITDGRIRATAVPNEEIKQGNYDALLIAVSGYRSNFLFDLYDLFLREPDLEQYRINLVTEIDSLGVGRVKPASLQASHNFFRMDAIASVPERDDMLALLEDVYGFMSTRMVGDKQAYARRVAVREHDMALAGWLFSLPSLMYFSSQFDNTSIDLYGIACQLSTLKKWKELPKK
ncbi:MAG: hypothetical protein V1799_05385 [bacterium]